MCNANKHVLFLAYFTVALLYSVEKGEIKLLSWKTATSSILQVVHTGMGEESSKNTMNSQHLTKPSFRVQWYQRLWGRRGHVSAGEMLIP
jgi:hypothetical protein